MVLGDMKNISECEPGSSFVKPRPRRTSCRKITLTDAEAIARRIVKTRCNEKDACIVLGFNYESWRTWKDRHKNAPLFDAIVTRIRESRIDNLITDIETIANGDEAIRLKPDWRAKQFVLQVTAPQRFVLNNPAAPAAVTADTGHMLESLKRAFLGPITDIDSKVVSDTENVIKTPLKAIAAPAIAIRTPPPRRKG